MVINVPSQVAASKNYGLKDLNILGSTSFFVGVPFSTVGRTLLERGNWSVGTLLLLLLEDAGQLKPLCRLGRRRFVLRTSALRRSFCNPCFLWRTLATLRTLVHCHVSNFSRPWVSRVHIRALSFGNSIPKESRGRALLALSNPVRLNNARNPGQKTEWTRGPHDVGWDMSKVDDLWVSWNILRLRARKTSYVETCSRNRWLCMEF